MMRATITSSDQGDGVRLTGLMRRTAEDAGASAGSSGVERRGSASRVRPWPVHPLLLAAYAVLFLFAENIAEVTFGEIVQPLTQALFGAGAVTLVAALVLRDLRRGALVATALLVGWFAFGHVSGLVAPMGLGQDLQLLGWAAFIALAGVAAVVLRERAVVAVTRGLDLVAGVLVSIAALQVVRHILAQPQPAVAAELPAAGRAARAGRDIYFLVWDRYGSESGRRGLGAGANDLPGWLESRGFIVARHAHANYGRTSMSLAATLNMTTLDEAIASVGPASDEPGPVHELIQAHAVGRFLKERGYRYIHIGSWFAPTRTVGIADENLAMPWGTDFEAKLEATTFKPTLDDLLGVPDPPKHHVLHRRSAQWQLRELDRVVGEDGPKFVLSHILLPHDPYVFDEIGEYPTEEERESRSEGDKYGRQTLFVDDQVRRIVDRLLDAPPDDQPVIVVAGDEGPFPSRYAADKDGFDWATASTTELETKFGILDAFYLPGEAPPGAPAPYPTMSAWNTFRVVLGRYFGADLPLLPDRTYTSRGWKSPYDLADVTERLPAPYGQAPPPAAI
jgi:hypothetical protein